MEKRLTNGRLTIDILVPTKIEQVLKSRAVLDQLVTDEWMWLEVLIPDSISDEQNKLVPEYGHEFTVIVDGVVDKWHENKPIGTWDEVDVRYGELFHEYIPLGLWRKNRTAQLGFVHVRVIKGLGVDAVR